MTAIACTPVIYVVTATKSLHTISLSWWKPYESTLWDIHDTSETYIIHLCSNNLGTCKKGLKLALNKSQLKFSNFSAQL